MGFGRPKGKPKGGERDVQVISRRMGNRCVCVCVGVRCVSEGRCRKLARSSAFYVCIGPPRVTRTPLDTYLAEFTPGTGLSHWWALPLVLPHTPRLGGDRLGCL